MLLLLASGRGSGTWCAGFASLLVALVGAGCVKLDNVFDCAALCDNRPHALTRCNGAGCISEGCDVGYADCNQNPQDGCEVNLASSRESCGVCGNACAVNDCVDGACWPVDSLTDNAPFTRGIALDADAVYFTSNDLADAGPTLRGSGSLYRISRSGNSQATLVSSGLDSMGAIVLDADAAYGFTTAYDYQTTTSGATVVRSDTRIFRSPKAGGPATFLGSTRLFANRPAVGDTDVFWPTEIDTDLDAGNLALEGGQLGAIAAQHAYAIARASKQGGPVSLLVTPRMDAFDLLMHDSKLFVASNGVQMVVPSSGATTTLVSDNFTWRVLVDATSVYWPTIDEETPRANLLKSIPLTGGTPTVLWRDPVKDQGFVLTLQMVDDGQNIYLAQSSGALIRVPKTPGNATILAGQQPCLSGVAVDETYVYWSGCAGIRRLRISEFAQ